MIFKPLDKKDLHQNPTDQFASWYAEAVQTKSISLPEAFCLSTISPKGEPEGRMLLLKGFDAEGFVFYTNADSAKGHSLEKEPRAALTFYWGELGKQIRIQGKTKKTSDAEADAYFATRPRESQIGAWASKQSEVLESRDLLEKRFEEFSKKFEEKTVPRPSYWVGYCLQPSLFEFWQECPNRLHDRFCYQKSPSGWAITRLYP